MKKVIKKKPVKKVVKKSTVPCPPAAYTGASLDKDSSHEEAIKTPSFSGEATPRVDTFHDDLTLSRGFWIGAAWVLFMEAIVALCLYAVLR